MRELPSRLIYLKLSSFLFTFIFYSSVFSQKTIVILDENALPLIGVEVFTKDFSFAETSDEDGIVDVPSQFSNQDLLIKYLGYEEYILELGSIDLNKIEVTLNPSYEILEEVVLIGRSDLTSRDLMQKVDAIKQLDIVATNPQTSVDALSRNADVYIQKSQMGGGSPVIRGFEANKVLLVVDGVRMNNAIYRNGHLQNAITVDNSVLDQIEVIYGPGSLMYGSDALGGVIHFRTKDPVLNLSSTKKYNVFGHYYGRFGSANNEKTGHFDINVGGQKWASLTSVTFSDFGNLRMGSRRTKDFPEYGLRKEFRVPTDVSNGTEYPDGTRINPRPNVQVGTAYNQLDILQKLRYQINEKMNLTANLQVSTSSNIPRYDQLILKTDGVFDFAEWNYGPQERLLASLKYKWTESKPWMDEMVVIAARQEIEESRFIRPFKDPWRMVGIENVGVNSFTIDLHKKWSVNEWEQRIFYGADANLNIVNSTAYEEHLIGGEERRGIFTRYPSGGSRMDFVGAYIQYMNESPDSTISLMGGLRYSAFRTNVQYDESDPIAWPSFFYDGITTRNSALSWSLGMKWIPHEMWNVQAQIATAFRSPNVDDIGKLRVKNDNVVVPNTSLEAEKSTNAEVNISYQIQRLNGRLSVSGFYTRLRDAIVRQNFMLPDGSTTFQDGERTYNVEANVNAENAEIAGMSVNIAFSPFRDWDFSSSVNYIRGRVISPEPQPLGHIPPLYGRTKIVYSGINSFTFTFLSQYNGAKPLDQYGGSVDNPEYATAEGALPWIVYNTYVDYSFLSYTLQLGVENILDKHYRQFASGVSAPGLNVILALRGSF